MADLGTGGAEGPFPGDRSPLTFSCPLCTGTVLHLPSCALGSSSLLILCPGSHSKGAPEGLGVLSDPPLTRIPASGAAPRAQQ